MVKTHITLQIVLAVVFLIHATLAYADPAAPLHSSPEECLGRLCISDMKLTENVFVDKYGKGFIKEEYDLTLHCYIFPKEHVFFEAGFDHSTHLPMRFFLSRESACADHSPISVNLSTFKTGAGIELGAAEDEVSGRYGRPTRIDDSIQREKRDHRYRDTDLATRFGAKVYVYLKGGNELLDTSFYFTNGKLRSILISTED